MTNDIKMNPVCKYCEWHLLQQEKRPVFATIIMHCTGLDYWNAVCKECLEAAILFEIEAIKGHYYVEAKPERIPIEKKSLRFLEIVN